MKTNPKILISLVNWLKYEDTINCVKSIYEFEYTSFEIAIVDNNSPNDSYKNLTEALPDIRIINSKENNGYAAGHKINVDYAIENNFDAIWILNSDVKLRKNTLPELISAWQQNGDHLYGSVTLSEENPDIVDFGGGKNPNDNPTEYLYNQYKNQPYKNLPKQNCREVQSIEGSSFFIPLEIIKKHGFMNLDYFMYAEECDYSHRLRKLGVMSFIVSSSIILHNSASSFKLQNDISWIMDYYRTRNAMRFAMNHYNWSKEKVKSLKHTIKNPDIKYYFLSILPYKGKYKNLYWRLRGSRDALNRIYGRTIDPNNYV